MIMMTIDTVSMFNVFTSDKIVGLILVLFLYINSMYVTLISNALEIMWDVRAIKTLAVNEVPCIDIGSNLDMCIMKIVLPKSIKLVMLE